MKRTIKPYKRKNIKKQDIRLDILEKNGQLFVDVKIDNLQDYDFPKKAQIFLEAYSRLDIDHIDLGTAGSFGRETKRELLPSFGPSQRAKIKFRLKVTDLKTYHLLGLAEKIKERKYEKSFFSITDSPIPSVFKIDWEDRDHPVLLVNQDLRECREDIKPLLAESAFREILQTLCLHEDFIDDMEDHKWIKFAEKHKPLPRSLAAMEYDDKTEWINGAVDAFSKKRKIPEKLKKRLKKD